MADYRLSAGDGSVLQEFSDTDRRTAEAAAVDLVAEHRASDPPGQAEYVLAENRSGEWVPVAHWGPLAP